MGILPFLLAVATTPPPNLLLVTIDTLRADRLGAYGYAAIDTPATDRLAREGILFEDATVQVPQTRPSHASILTGRLPYEHGIRDNYSPPLNPRLPTLATTLRGKGYRTAAFIGSYALASISGLDRGFELYDEPFSEGGKRTAVYTRPERPAAEVVDSTLTWLRRPRTGPFFAWVHLYDPHSPYVPPAPFAGRYAERPYDGEVAYSDAQVGRLLDFLDRQGLRGRTLVVVTADHGEGLGEHGEDEHLMFVYDSTLRVPLIVSWPGTLPSGIRLGGQFRSVDLLPTLLDLMGLPPVPTGGLSRAASLRKGARLADNESYAESLFGSVHFGYAPLRALRAEGWKLIDAPRPELYNLREDPGETRNLVDLRGQVAARMRERLRTYDTGGGSPPPVAPGDPGSMERLAALGYVGGAVPLGGAGSGADPKDKIQEYQDYTRGVQNAIRLYREGQLDEALALLTRLSKAETVSLEVQYFLGKSLLRKERYAEAARALEGALALVPRWTETYLDLSRAYTELGKLRDGVSVLERGLRLDPGNAAFQRERGILLYGLGDLSRARTALEGARSLDPRNVRLRLALSAVYRDQGNLAGAIAEVRETVRLNPGSGDGWNALGLLLAASGKDGEAAEAFRGALKADPEDPDALFNLAGHHLREDKPEDALPLLERLAAKAPAFPGATEALETARQGVAPLASGLARLRILRVAERRQAEEIARRLAAGEDFAALVRSLSVDPSAAKGGDLGVVRVADLAEPLRSGAADLAPGGVSPVLETASGYVLLKREH
jgi:arylsulfatase A-like enzyme/tetratricopeptide (TPR) repeat protein